MTKLRFDLPLLLAFSVFTGVYTFVGYFLISKMPLLAYQVVFSVIALIIYLNLLRFFILALYSLSQSKISQLMGFFMLYMITLSIITLPWLLEPRETIDAPVLRYVIIAFAAILLTKYTVYMLLGPWHDVVAKFKELLRSEEGVPYQPFVSVLIPAWNEGVGIVDTVKSVVKSHYRNLEVIVINDGSTDDSDWQMKNFLVEHANSSQADVSVRYYYQNNTGKGGALNHALSVARGDILVSVDADCYVDEQAIDEFVKAFRDPKVMGAVGNVKIGNRDSTVGIVQYLEFLFSFYFKRADALLGSIYIIGGAAGAFRREVFEQLGGYRTDNITEDIELTVRMQDAGMKIEYANEAVVYTEGASDIASLKKQRLRWKLGRFQTFYQSRHLFFSTKPHHNKALTWFVLPLSIIQEIHLLLEIPFLLFLYVFSMVNNDFSSFLTGIMIVSTMFFVQFLFYDKSTRNWSFIALAPIGWLLFYVATYVEVYALIKSIESFVFKKKVIWQKWERQGVGRVAKTTF